MKKEKGKDTNRNYKDTVFQLLFNDKEKLVELYNALEGESCVPADTQITVETLQEAIFNRMVNDLAFQVNGQCIILVEHQSTVNENMAVRMFLYLARVLEKTLDLNQLHWRKTMTIPTPHLYVLYNGEEEYPEEHTLKLSDTYRKKEPALFVEVEVKILNINKEKGSAMLERSRTLREYSAFVAMVRERIKEGLQRDEAIKQAIKECVEQGILREFLEKHGEEVAGRMFREYTIDDMLQIRADEARSDGLEEGLRKGKEEGLEEGLRQVALRMKRAGMDIQTIVEATGLTREQIERLAEAEE